MTSSRPAHGTKLTVKNVFEGHGFGKLILPLALRGARKDADAFAERIKQAVESRPGSPGPA